MTVYIRDEESNIWHWNPLCSHYPNSKNTKTRKTKPMQGMFCPECIRLSKNPYFCGIHLEEEKRLYRLET